MPSAVIGASREQLLVQLTHPFKDPCLDVVHLGAAAKPHPIAPHRSLAEPRERFLNAGAVVGIARISRLR